MPVMESIHTDPDLDPDVSSVNSSVLMGTELSTDTVEYLKGLGVNDPYQQYDVIPQNGELFDIVQNVSDPEHNPEAIFDIMALEQSRRNTSTADDIDIQNLLPAFLRDTSRDSQLDCDWPTMFSKLIKRDNGSTAARGGEMKAKRTNRHSVKRSKYQRVCPGSDLPGAVSRPTDVIDHPPQRRTNKVNERSGRTKHVTVIGGLCLETRATLMCPSHLIKSCGKKKQEDRAENDALQETGFNEVRSRDLGYGLLGGVKDNRDGATGAVLVGTSRRATSLERDYPDGDPEQRLAIEQRPRRRRLSGKRTDCSSLDSVAENNRFVRQSGSKEPLCKDNSTKEPCTRTHPTTCRTSISDIDTCGTGVAELASFSLAMDRIDPAADPGHANLLRAAGGGDLKLLKTHLDGVTSMDNVTDTRGNTALHLAVIGGHLPCVQVLAEKCPSLARQENRAKDTPVLLSIQHGQIEILDWFLDNTDVVKENQMKACKKPLLHQAARCGQDGCLRLLLERVPGIQQCVDKYGNTAAHLAAKHGNLTCLQTLVEFGLDVTMANNDGHTPCYYADFANQRQCVGYLMVVECCKALAERAIQLHIRLKHYDRANSGVTSSHSASQDDIMPNAKDISTNISTCRVWTLVRHQFKRLERQLLVYRTKSYDVEKKYLRPHYSVTTDPSTIQRKQSFRSTPEADRAITRPSEEEGNETRNLLQETKCSFSPEKIKRLYSGLWALRRSFDRHGSGLEDDIFSVKSENITRTCAKVQPMPRTMQPYLARSSQTIAAVSPVTKGRAQQRKEKSGVYRQTRSYECRECGDGPQTYHHHHHHHLSRCVQHPAPGSWYDGIGGDESRESDATNTSQTGSSIDGIGQSKPAKKSAFKSFGWHGLDYHFKRKCNKDQSECSNAVGNPRATVGNIVQPPRNGEDSVKALRPVGRSTALDDGGKQPSVDHNVCNREPGAIAGHHNVQNSSSVRQYPVKPVRTLMNARCPATSMQQTKLPSFPGDQKTRSLRKKHSWLFFSEGSDNSSSDTNNMTFYRKSENASEKERRWIDWVNQVRPRVCATANVIQRTANQRKAEEDVTSTGTSDTGATTSRTPQSRLIGKVKGHRVRPHSAEGTRSGSSRDSGAGCGKVRERFRLNKMPICDSGLPERKACCTTELQHGTTSVHSSVSRSGSCLKPSDGTFMSSANKLNDNSLNARYGSRYGCLEVEEGRDEGRQDKGQQRSGYSGRNDVITSRWGGTFWYKPSSEEQIFRDPYKDNTSSLKSDRSKKTDPGETITDSGKDREEMAAANADWPRQSSSDGNNIRCPGDTYRSYQQHYSLL